MFGIRGKVALLIRNYLKDRLMTVKVSNTYSERVEINRGVPQGSILGPLLYLIYVNDIGKCFDKCKYFLYADDTVIISVHADIHSANRNLQDEFYKFQLWAHDKQLQINLKKTKIMHIRSPHKKFTFIPNILFHNLECIHRGVRVEACGCTDQLECVGEQ